MNKDIYFEIIHHVHDPITFFNLSLVSKLFYSLCSSLLPLKKKEFIKVSIITTNLSLSFDNNFYIDDIPLLDNLSSIYLINLLNTISHKFKSESTVYNYIDNYFIDLVYDSDQTILKLTKYPNNYLLIEFFNNTSNNLLLSLEFININNHYYLHGKLKKYNDSHLISECIFKHNLRHGHHKGYDLYNNIIFDLFYSNDLLSDTNIVYYYQYNNSTILNYQKHLYHYKDGLLNGSTIFFNNDSIIRNCNFLNNKLYGLYQEFYISGQLKLICFYINNKKQLLYQEFYDSGQLKLICSYENNKKNGDYKLFYVNGFLKYHCFYINNKKVGISNKYNKQGLLVSKHLYPDNKLSYPTLPSNLTNPYSFNDLLSMTKLQLQQLLLNSGIFHTNKFHLTKLQLIDLILQSNL